MRLIDADMLKFDYEDATGITEEEKEFACALIDEQPTAYDLDGVLENLNRDIGSLICGDGYDAECRANEIIKIVKGGTADE